MEANWMHGWGSGRRVSSARMAVSSRRRASSFSAASASRGRFVELRHICWARQCRWGERGGTWLRGSWTRGMGPERDSNRATPGGKTYEEAAVLALEAMEALRGVPGGGVFPGRARSEGGVAQEARPLFVSPSALHRASPAREGRQGGWGSCGADVRSPWWLSMHR